MSLRAARVIPALLISGLAFFAGTQVAGQQRSPIMITRLYTGPDGQTHQDRTEIRLTPSTMYSNAEASEAVRVSQAQFFRLPKGKVQDWHNPAHRQYVVTLTGRGEVEIAGRQKILINPGRVILLENVTGRGHITRSIGSEDLTFFIGPLRGSVMPLASAPLHCPIADRRCRCRALGGRPNPRSVSSTRTSA